MRDLRPLLISLSRTRRGVGPGASAPEPVRCRLCGRATSERKPVCAEHVLVEGYGAEVAREWARRERAAARAVERGARRRRA